MLEKQNFPFHDDLIDNINNSFISRGWVTLSDERLFSCLVEEEQTIQCMEGHNWDLTPECSGVEVNDFNVFSKSYEDYIEPIVVYQQAAGTYLDYFSLSEEFCLLYQLRKKQKSNDESVYIKIDECGDEVEIARQKKCRIQVKVQYVKEYLALKKMNLLIFYDDVKYGVYPSESKENELQKSNTYIFNYCTNPKLEFSWIQGKLLIENESRSIKGLWNEHDERHEDFIIGVDNSTGDEIKASCEENQLENLFQHDTGFPSTLTPVYFKKEVLDDYYNNPARYSVRDGIVDSERWSLRVDNDSNDYVIVMIVDLGKVPYKVQQHWKQYNIVPPLKDGLSNTAQKRWFYGISTNVTVSFDLVLKKLYTEVNDEWNKRYNWPLFLPLQHGDEHYLTSLHSMTEENEKVFDEQILSVAKVFIDSLNVKELRKNIDEKNTEVSSHLCIIGKKINEITGIGLLELFCIENNINANIQLYRNIQELRSSSAAHRKSKDFETKKFYNYFHFSQKRLDEVFNYVLEQLIIDLKVIKGKIQ